MKTKTRWILLLALVAVLALWSVTASSQSSRGDDELRDLIMIRCNATSFSVDEYKGSTSAPGRKSGNCADQLAQLVRESFTIVDFAHFDTQDAPFIVYTLAR